MQIVDSLPELGLCFDHLGEFETQPRVQAETYARFLRWLDSKIQIKLNCQYTQLADINNNISQEMSGALNRHMKLVIEGSQHIHSISVIEFAHNCIVDIEFAKNSSYLCTTTPSESSHIATLYAMFASCAWIQGAQLQVNRFHVTLSTFASLAVCLTDIASKFPTDFANIHQHFNTAYWLGAQDCFVEYLNVKLLR